MKPTRWIALALVTVLSLTALTLGTSAQEDDADQGDPHKNTFGPRGVVTLVDDEENVAASELVGTWVPAMEISTGLLPPGADMSRESGFTQIAYTYTFRESDAAAERIKAAFENALAKLREDKFDKDKVPYLERAFQAVYLTGEVTITPPEGAESETYDFALVNMRGNPHVVYLEEDGDTESQIIMLARDEDGDMDVLWVGGDFNSSDMSPLIRKEHAEKLRSDDDAGAVRQVNFERHLLSQNIWGEWEPQDEIAAIIAGREVDDDVTGVTFERDEEATKKIIAQFEDMVERIKKMGGAGSEQGSESLLAFSRVYASGRMTTKTLEGETNTEFALVNIYGSPMIAWNRADGKVQFLRIQYVHHAAGDNDLLFMSTDLPENTPQALKRKVGN